ncbi:hypothetical protein Tco_0762594, partial [Tanacetum coccineum]
WGGVGGSVVVVLGGRGDVGVEMAW